MIARFDNIKITNKCNEPIGVCITVNLYGDGRGMYATPSQQEADFLQEALEWYIPTKSALKKCEAEVERLKKVNAKLRRKLKQEGNGNDAG